LEDLKREKEIEKLENRYYELKDKPKLTSTERKRLDELTIKLKEYYGDDFDKDEEE
jgi:hypothetical protein